MKLSEAHYAILRELERHDEVAPDTFRGRGGNLLKVLVQLGYCEWIRPGGLEYRNAIGLRITPAGRAALSPPASEKE